EPRGDAEPEVGDVLPVPVAPELARGDRVVGDAGLRHAPGLDAVAAPDPFDGDAGPAHEGGGDGEARAGVPARAAARDDHQGTGARAVARYWGTGARAIARPCLAVYQRRSRASSMSRVISAGYGSPDASQRRG